MYTKKEIKEIIHEISIAKKQLGKENFYNSDIFNCIFFPIMVKLHQQVGDEQYKKLLKKEGAE